MTNPIAFEVAVGSYNYRLYRPHRGSDKDYKEFYYPTFNTLYEGDKQSVAKKSLIVDKERHDVRKLPDMLYKANVNFLEVLFSLEVLKKDALYQKLVAMKEDIARMNLPYLFEACFLGMFDRKLREFDRDTNYVDFREPEGALQDKVCKHVMVAYRILDFLERYANNGFTSFGNAISYRDDNEADQVAKQFLFSVRDGEFYSFGGSQMKEILLEKKEKVEPLRELYISQKANQELNQTVIQIVKDAVKEQLLLELSR